MKRYVFKILIFLLLMVLIDRGVGYTLSYMADHARGGYIGHHNYIVNDSRDDVLVFGSSRAIHHYNTPMMQDSLGLTCYNCGQDGEGIVLFYAWWQLITQRYHPRLVIYEVTPGYDLMAGDSNRLSGWLKGLYDHEAVQRICDDIDPTERYKMMSMLYRYNSKFHQILLDYFHPVHTMDRGFLPVDSELDPLAVKTDDQQAAAAAREVKLDSLKLSYFDAMLDGAGTTRFVFVCSPSWYGTRDPELDALKSLASRHGVPVLDYSASPAYVHQDRYFYDGYHLNARGADQFTRTLIADLRRLHLVTPK